MKLESVERDDQLTPCRRMRGARGVYSSVLVEPAVVRLREIAPTGPPRAATASAWRPDGHGGGRRMLIVDDKERYRAELAQFFGSRGWHLTVVASAAEGLALVRVRGVHEFAAVVSDISMELELAGIWLMRHLGRLDYPGITILASTGFDNWFGVLTACTLLPPGPPQWLMPKRALVAGHARFIRNRGLV